METRTFLGLPSYGLLDSGMAMMAIASPTANKHRIAVVPEESSLLAKCFNNLWTQALNDPQYTHFAMLHADIIPDACWLDVLHEEMERTGADIIGVVSPIKDVRGVTSIGIANHDYAWSPKKRFTIREIMKLPETFSAADAGYPGEPLLLNTGCWLADLRNPKWRETDEFGDLKIYFTIRDRVTTENGKLISCVQSEDWFFSRCVHDAGLKALCTRKVGLKHIGKIPFPNNVEWGDYEAGDKDTERFWKKPECLSA